MVIQSKEETYLGSKLEDRAMEEGQRICTIGPCAGGWGDPFERDPEKVRADVLDDLVSRERAESEYGVVLTDNLNVDEEATAELRGKQ